MLPCPRAIISRLTCVSRRTRNYIYTNNIEGIGTSQSTCDATGDQSVICQKVYLTLIFFSFRPYSIAMGNFSLIDVLFVFSGSAIAQALGYFLMFILTLLYILKAGILKDCWEGRYTLLFLSWLMIS